VIIPAPAVLEARPGEPVALPRDLDCQRADGVAESYRLSVSADGVAFSAADDAGEARGRATLRQLGETSGPLLIEDAPRYAWRGVMLDVARHFFGVDEVLRLIDLAALYKLNVLHLHLTDDQGWRIESEKWPRLTENGTQIGGGPAGFYTRADYAEIVRYAADRFITVIPELDVPGHTNAALVAYPELWNPPAPPVETGIHSPGRSIDVRDPKVLAWLDDVVGELAGHPRPVHPSRRR